MLAEPHSSATPGDPHALPWPRPSSEGPSKPSSSRAGGQGRPPPLTPAPQAGSSLRGWQQAPTGRTGGQ